MNVEGFSHHEPAHESETNETQDNPDGVTPENAEQKRMNLEGLKRLLVERMRNLQTNEKWQNSMLVRFWNSVGPEDQQALYNNGSTSLKNILMNKSHPLLMQIKAPFQYKDMRLKLLGPSFDVTFRTYVQCGLLQFQNGAQISPEQVADDIIRDHSGIENVVTALEMGVSFFAPEAIPQIAAVKEVALQLNDLRTDVIQESRPDSFDTEIAA